jgi:hypothetical protein
MSIDEAIGLLSIKIVLISMNIIIENKNLAKLSHNDIIFLGKIK